MPATGALIGTPASISASELPQTLAIDDEPFDSRISETTRMVYGNWVSSGRTAESARNPASPPSGCYFHPRCPFAMARCRDERPALVEIAPGRWSACHLNDATASG